MASCRPIGRWTNARGRLARAGSLFAASEVDGRTQGRITLQLDNRKPISFLHRSVVIGAQSSSRWKSKLKPLEKVQNLDDCYHRWARREIELLLPPTASRILDVGAGVGTTSRWLKDRYNGAFALALEGNPDLLGELRQNVDEAHIVDLNGSLPDVGAPDLVRSLTYRAPAASGGSASAIDCEHAG